MLRDRQGCSERALTRFAGVSHTLIREGRLGRFILSQRVAAELVRTLRQWGSDCALHASAIESAAAAVHSVAVTRVIRRLPEW